MSENANRLLEIRAGRILSVIKDHRIGWPPRIDMPEERGAELEALVRALILLACRPNGRDGPLSAEQQKKEAGAGRNQYESFSRCAWRENWMSTETSSELDRLVYALIALAYPKTADLLRCPRCGHWLDWWACKQEEGDERCGFAWVYETIPDEVQWAFNGRSGSLSEGRDLHPKRYSGPGVGGCSPCGS